MPDGTSRFTLKSDRSTIFHFMGCSTFSEYTVLAEISCAKINPSIPQEHACLFGCGIATGLGAVWNTAKVEPFSSVAVFGLGAVGLAVVQAAKAIGAHPIIGIDVNEKKFAIAKQLGCTDCVERTLKGEIKVEHFITHKFKGVAETTKALEALHSGDCLRAVVEY